MRPTNGQITRNFNRSEFACQCGCGFDAVSLAFVQNLQRLRDALPKMNGKRRRIHITSGCRCPKHNAMVGGSKDSRHIHGDAADLWADGMTAAELYQIAAGIPDIAAGGIGLYPTYRRGEGILHLDDRPRPARWGKVHPGQFIGINEAIARGERNK